MNTQHALQISADFLTVFVQISFLRSKRL